MKAIVKVKNETDYRTDVLKDLFTRCANLKGVERSDVRVFYAKRGYGVCGWAWLNTTHSSIRIPKELHSSKTMEEYVKIIAQVYLHELDHNLGLKHGNMMPYNEQLIPDLTGIVLTKNEPVTRAAAVIEKPKADIKRKRFEMAVNRLEKAEVDLAHAKARVSKWQSKVKYYRKKYGY